MCLDTITPSHASAFFILTIIYEIAYSPAKARIQTISHIYIYYCRRTLAGNIVAQRSSTTPIYTHMLLSFLVCSCRFLSVIGYSILFAQEELSTHVKYMALLFGSSIRFKRCFYVCHSTSTLAGKQSWWLQEACNWNCACHLSRKLIRVRWE